MKVLLNDEMMKCWNKNDEQNSLNDEMMKCWNKNDEQNSLNDEMMKWWTKNDEQNSLNDEMIKWWNSVRNWNSNSTPVLVGQTWTWQRVGGTSIPYRFVTVLVYNSLWIYCAQRTHRSSAKQGKQTKLDTWSTSAGLASKPLVLRHFGPLPYHRSADMFGHSQWSPGLPLPFLRGLVDSVGPKKVSNKKFENKILSDQKKFGEIFWKKLRFFEIFQRNSKNPD